MTQTLSFPKLGWEFELNPVVFQITDTWAIKWYGIIVTVAFVAACAYILRRTKTFGLDPDRALDVLMGAILGGIVGARIYYVLFSWDSYKDNLWSVLRIWQGGIAIYGGIIGGLIVGALVCRWRRVKLLPMMDATAAGLLLGQAIGRWGNFVNIEAFGANTDALWGMTSPLITWYLQIKQAELAAIGVIVDPYAPVHPTFLYESIWCLIGFAALVWYTKRRRFDGELSLLYAGWYGLGRVWIEGLRTDSLMLGGVRISQLLAGACVLVAVAVLVYLHRKSRKNGAAPLFVNTEDGQAVINGTFYGEDKEIKPKGKQSAKQTADVEKEHASTRPAARDSFRSGREPLRGEKRMAQRRQGDYPRRGKTR